MIYLDYNATTPMKPAVRAAMLESMERHGNPSSVHRYGRIARRYIEDARAAVAALVGVAPNQVVFTSGGTEANAMVFHGLRDTPFITSTIEHPSVIDATPGARRIPVTRGGVVDLEAAETILKSAPSNSLVSVMLVNNETGVIQPIAEIVRMARHFGHRVHTDAVQAAQRLPIDFAALGVDFLTLSAHKLGGPQGMGALIMAPQQGLNPMLRGGGQEMGRRAGTENVAAIIGFGIAVQLAADDLREMPRLSLWRDELQLRLETIAGGDIHILGEDSPRVANTLSVAMRGVGSETQVMAMDLAGVAVSAGSACSSGKVKVSHVLRAMGFTDDIAGSALRISLGWATHHSDLDRCVEAWRVLYERKNGRSRSAAA